MVYLLATLLPSQANGTRDGPYFSTDANNFAMLFLLVGVFAFANESKESDECRDAQVFPDVLTELSWSCFYFASPWNWKLLSALLS